MTTDDSRRVSVLLGVLFGVAGMGSSSASVVLPMMADDLGTTVGLAAWTISLYALMFAVTTAIYGRVSDLVGVRTPLLAGVGLMALGATVATFAPSYEVLLAARVLQGAGAAAVPTLGVALLSHRYDGAVRGLALARLAGIAAAITSLGPLLGGLAEAAVGWRATMALPVLSLAVLPFLRSALHTEGTRARLDLVGAVLVAGTSAGLILLIQSPSSGVVVALVGSALLLAGAPLVAMWVTRRPHGFLPLSVVRNGAVIRSALAAAAVPASWFAMLVAVPAVLVARGWEAWQVGLLLIPAGVVGLLLPRFSGPILVRLGGPATLGLAAALAAVSTAVAAGGVHLDSATLLAAAIALVSFAFGVGQPALTISVGEAVEAEVRGVALGVATLLFMAGGSVGAAVVAGLGAPLGITGSLLVVAALPVLGLAAMAPAVRRAAVAA